MPSMVVASKAIPVDAMVAVFLVEFSSEATPYGGMLRR